MNYMLTRDNTSKVSLTRLIRQLNTFTCPGELNELMEFKSEHGFRPVYSFDCQGQPMAIFSPGVGAPLTAKYLELLIAQGCKYFIALGACGVLDSDLEMGDIIITDSAVRDEGTSFHYLPPGRSVKPSSIGVKAVEKTLQKHLIPYQRAKTWTTDGYYRETKNKIQK
jgi:uridine phosphorylase